MKRIFNLLATTTIFATGSYFYIYNKTSKNLKQHESTLEAGTLKDASRLSNDSFGISWGFQADDIIMNKIDSGDYLFIKYDCSECLSVSEYVECNWQCMWKLDEEFDSVGYAFRNSEGLWVLYNQFGHTRIRKYSELVGMPYLKGLIIQKNSQKAINVHRKMKEHLENGEGGVKNVDIQESAVQMANRINEYLYGDSSERVIDLRELIRTSQQILVRTQTNRSLRSL